LKPPNKASSESKTIWKKERHNPPIELNIFPNIGTEKKSIISIDYLMLHTLTSTVSRSLVSKENMLSKENEFNNNIHPQ